MDTNFTKEGKFIEDIKQIKTKKQALSTGGKQFLDKDFPTEIGIDALNDVTIHWKRIKEMDVEAQLYNAGSRINGEMCPGLIGDSPLIPVLSAIVNHPKLLHYIFPLGQDFNDPDYCGLFYFRIWKMGKWVYVIVDDRIPIVGNKKADEPKKKDKSKAREQQATDSSKTDDRMRKDEIEDEQPQQQEKEIVMGKSDEEKKNSVEKLSGLQQPPQTDGETKLSANQEPSKDEVKPNDHVPIQGAEGPETKSSIAKQQNEEMIIEEPETQNIKPSKSSEVTFEPKTSIAKLEVDALEAKRSSECVGKASLPSRGSIIYKDGVGDIDSEKVANRNYSSIFVRVFGSDGKLYYWATLLEKAYAKAYGGYSQLPKISITKTLLDLTGGVTEISYTSHLPKEFFLNFKNFYDSRAIILAATNLPIKREEQAEPKDGMTTSLFAVTSVILADFRKSLGRDKIVGFVRLLNPSGEIKWAEPWAETYQEWEVLPPLVAKKLKMESRKIGEFYLTYRNFLRAFSMLIICTVPDGENFNAEGYFGEWTKPKFQYDLCRIDNLRFHEFPQHKIWVRDPNAEDTEVDVLLSLVQNGQCCCSETPYYNTMQLFLFCMDMNRTHTLPLNFEFFRYNRPIGFSNVSLCKELTARFKLPQGHYLVVPVIDYTTMVHPCQANDYILRVITPAKFSKPPPQPLSTFTNSENLNIYFDLAETLGEHLGVASEVSKELTKSEIEKAAHKEKGKGKKKKIKH